MERFLDLEKKYIDWVRDAAGEETADFCQHIEFQPFNIARAKLVFEPDEHVVHYTSAEAVANILDGKEFWLRNSQTMSDWSEVHHGLAAVAAIFDNETAAPLRELMDSIRPGCSNEFYETYNSARHDLALNTYIGSFSQHSTADLSYGRLSMWRAYGQKIGAAIVVRRDAFMGFSDAIGTYSFPALYFDLENLRVQLHAWIQKLLTHRDRVSAILEAEGPWCLTDTLHCIVHCLKHPGYSEEQEWRLVYRPQTDNVKALQRDWRSIRGLPQSIYKIGLREYDDIDLSPANIVEKIIIGPNENPRLLKRFFEELLTSCGVENPEERIVVSNIPERFAG